MELELKGGAAAAVNDAAAPRTERAVEGGARKEGEAERGADWEEGGRREGGGRCAVGGGRMRGDGTWDEEGCVKGGEGAAEEGWIANVEPL